MYFHYLTSVFQLHLHVCCTPPVDGARRQYLPRTRFGTTIRCVLNRLFLS
jgi:hypothetical protein